MTAHHRRRVEEHEGDRPPGAGSSVAPGVLLNALVGFGHEQALLRLGGMVQRLASGEMFEAGTAQRTAGIMGFLVRRRIRPCSWPAGWRQGNVGSGVRPGVLRTSTGGPLLHGPQRVRRTATTLPRMAALSPGIGSYAGLRGISHIRPSSRRRRLTVASPSRSAVTASPWSAGSWRRTVLDVQAGEDRVRPIEGGQSGVVQDGCQIHAAALP